MRQKKTTPLVSVVVPIYNSEKYLKTCLNSISAQTYKNLEIILVNDGSTDGSLCIALEFAQRDKRTKLISQVNSGVAAARQNGVAHAIGAYIIHADSDDELPLDALELLCDSAAIHNSDIVLGDYIIQKKLTKKIEHLKFTSSKEILLLEILTGHIHAGLWNKLIKRSLYNLASFEPEIDFTEDKLFLCRAISRSKSLTISHVNKPVYIYKIRAGSYTTKFTEKSLKDFIASTDIICSELNHIYDNDFLDHLKLKTEVIKIINTKTVPSKDILKKIYLDHRLSFSRRILVWLTANRIPSPLHFYKKLKAVISNIQ